MSTMRMLTAVTKKISANIKKKQQPNQQDKFEKRKISSGGKSE